MTRHPAAPLAAAPAQTVRADAQRAPGRGTLAFPFRKTAGVNSRVRSYTADRASAPHGPARTMQPFQDVAA